MTSLNSPGDHSNKEFLIDLIDSVTKPASGTDSKSQIIQKKVIERETTPSEFETLTLELTLLKSKSLDGLSKDQALELAFHAAELSMRFMKLAQSPKDKAAARAQTESSLDQVERVKSSTVWHNDSADQLMNLTTLQPIVLNGSYQGTRKEVSTSKVELNGKITLPQKENAKPTPFSHTTVSPVPKALPQPVSLRSIPKNENILLWKQGKLNGSNFPPWPDQAPSIEDFMLKPGRPKFTDDAPLALSKEQESIFEGWKRPDEALPPPGLQAPLHDERPKPCMASQSNIDLVQNAATDCSVVASLCAGVARFESGHPKITNTILFPWDTENGVPMISESGKYHVRMNFNGCFRIVQIDDRLPVSKNSSILHVIDRNNPSLLWPALIEKAYLKVRGGYNFPGSNSGTDLWILTGWIPEQIFLQADEVDSSQLWSRLSQAYDHGDVLITMGTGRISAEVEKSIGLVGEHDYALLDLCERKGRKQVLVKNPWFKAQAFRSHIKSSQGFLGTIEELSSEEELDVDTGYKTGSDLSPGSFWMTMDEVMQNFETMYLNWNPGLFLFRVDIHFTWDLNPKSGKGKSAYGSSLSNPQHVITCAKDGHLWILLSRHFKDKVHTGNPDEFISLYIFDSDGERVNHVKGSIQHGPYVDSPQTLSRIEAKAGKKYTVVTCEQDLASNEYAFTLSAFSRSKIDISLAKARYPLCTSIQGSWTNETAGGSVSGGSFSINPQFRLQLTQDSPVRLFIETFVEDLRINIKLLHGRGDRVQFLNTRDIIIDSGNYRRGSAETECLTMLTSGAYTIICSAFAAKQLGDFTLHAESQSKMTLELIQSENAGRIKNAIHKAIFMPGVRKLQARVECFRLARVLFAAESRDAPNGGSSLRISTRMGSPSEGVLMSCSADGQFRNASSSISTGPVDLNPGTKDSVHTVWIVIERQGDIRRQAMNVCYWADAVEPLRVRDWEVLDD